ncbi:MAG: hypothetical protein MZW92_80210 [Comamonadaceae bacterium]|nr:hypothetical protein [Comamonadaceae bacterium]
MIRIGERPHRRGATRNATQADPPRGAASAGDAARLDRKLLRDLWHLRGPGARDRAGGGLRRRRASSRSRRHVRVAGAARRPPTTRSTASPTCSPASSARPSALAARLARDPGRGRRCETARRAAT